MSPQLSISQHAPSENLNYDGELLSSWENPIPSGAWPEAMKENPVVYPSQQQQQHPKQVYHLLHNQNLNSFQGLEIMKELTQHWQSV